MVHSSRTSVKGIRIQGGMAFGRIIYVLLIAIALLASGQHVASNNVEDTAESGVKIPKNINYQGKFAQNLINEYENDDNYVIVKMPEMDSRKDSFDDKSDYNETDFHAMADKPSKFDRDISDFIHTDVKSMHESEAARLKAESETKESEVSTDAALSVAEDRVDTNDDESNFTLLTLVSSHEKDTPIQKITEDSLDRCNKTISMACLEKDLDHLVDEMSAIQVYNITDFAQIVRNSSLQKSDSSAREISVADKVINYAKEHVLRISIPSDASLARGSRLFFGAISQIKSPFLIGFGLGFLAFGLKKLMLPLFIGMQIVKSVLIALFLPSILGGIGKILGKGVSTFSQVSQGAGAQPEESYDFKDNSNIYNDDYMQNQPIGTLPASAMYDQQGLLNTGNQYSGSTGANQRISYVNTLSDNYYSRNGMQGANKRQDYKVFHEIPTSSLLLTNYDPFYSPLLSRLDAVFSRLGHSTEGCREYAICAMYKSPARYAPYSNLVSAQLSRELNELRKPTSDNPDVLRFFKYMKAAKDGQDGVDCEGVYTECASRGNPSGQNQAMLATYQDINKLVQARKIH